jgi:hypothetical protein
MGWTGSARVRRKVPVWPEGMSTMATVDPAQVAVGECGQADGSRIRI